MNHLVPIPVIAAKLELKITNSGENIKTTISMYRKVIKRKQRLCRDLSLEGRELSGERFLFIRCSQVTRHQVARTQAKTYGLTGFEN